MNLHYGSHKQSVTVDYFTESANIFLPLPALDSKAGTTVHLATITESIKINEDEYNNEFGYVTTIRKDISSAVLAFLILTIGGFVCVLISVTLYCRYRKAD